MHFPNNGGGRPFVRIDGRSGSFALSVQDGDPEIVEMRGKTLVLDVVKATQGWLKLSKDGAEWTPLAERDGWSAAPKPSPDHAAAVELDVFCKQWPEPRVRTLRGSSKCVTSFVARICDAAGTVPEDRAVAVAITGAKVVRIGRGTSAEILFTLAPEVKWPPRAFFDAARDEAAAETPKPEPAKPEPAETSFDDLEDAFT